MMQQLAPRTVTIVERAANDLPAAKNVERARLRERDRNLRGPSWSARDRSRLGA